MCNNDYGPNKLSKSVGTYAGRGWGWESPLEAAGGEKFVGGEDKGVITEQVSIAIADSAPGERSIGQVSRNVPLPAGKRGKVRMRTVGPALTHNNICSTLFTKLPGCIDMACEL